MPVGSVRLHSIKKLGQDNNAYDVTDEPTSYMTMTTSPKDDQAKKKAEQPAIRIGFFQLFRFASKRDVLMMVVGTLCAVLHGSAQPLMLLVFGMLTDTFIDYDIELNELMDDRKECLNNTIRWRQNLTATTQDWTNGSSAWELLKPLQNRTCGILDIEYEMTNFAYYYVGIGIAVFILGYFQISLWVTSAARQVQIIRKLYFGRVMRMEIGWFDCNSVGELNTRMSE